MLPGIPALPLSTGTPVRLASSLRQPRPSVGFAPSIRAPIWLPPRIADAVRSIAGCSVALAVRSFALIYETLLPSLQRYE